MLANAHTTSLPYSHETPSPMRNTETSINLFLEWRQKLFDYSWQSDASFPQTVGGNACLWWKEETGTLPQAHSYMLPVLFLHTDRLKTRPSCFLLYKCVAKWSWADIFRLSPFFIFLKRGQQKNPHHSETHTLYRLLKVILHFYFF